MTNYWLHRISHEWDVSKVLFDQGYLTIGWSDLVESDVLKLARKGEKEFDDLMKIKDIAYRSRWSLYRFFEMQPGDVVVVPLYSGEFAIVDVVQEAQTISSLKINTIKSLSGKQIGLKNKYLRTDPPEDRVVDLGFFIKIKNQDNIKKRSWADPKLQSRMKMRQTNGQIDDLNLQKSIESARSALKPVNLQEVMRESMAKLILDNIQKNVSHNDFEKLVKWYMEKLGATEVYIPAKNEKNKQDGADADVIAQFEPLSLDIIIQVKKHDTNTETSDWAVKQINEYKIQKIGGSDSMTQAYWVITSATFSEKAKALAPQYGIRLIEGMDFAEMLLDVGLAGLDTYLQ